MMLAALLVSVITAPAWAAGVPQSSTELLQRLQALEDVRANTRIAAEFPAHVRPGGALAKDGEALARVARAAIESGAVDLAESLLVNARAASGTLAVEVERARLSLARDELGACSSALVIEDGSGTRMRYPEDPRAWILFARAQARLQEYGAAEKAARQYLRLAPYGRDSAIAWQVRTDAALRRNDGSAAHAHLREARHHRQWHELLVARRIQRQRDPEAELPQLGIALLRLEARQYAAAKAELLQLTGRKPGFCRGWFHLGESERLLGQAQDAEAAYDRALGCDPEHAPSRANRATLRLNRGDRIGARLDLERLLAGPAEKNPRYIGSHLQLARVLLEHEARAEAEARYERYLELGGREPLEP